jgi:hypothetical protein
MTLRVSVRGMREAQVCVEQHVFEQLSQQYVCIYNQHVRQHTTTHPNPSLGSLVWTHSTSFSSAA